MPGTSRLLCCACLVISVLVPVGCGGDSQGLSSGLPATLKLNDLTDAEKAQLCDWAVAKFGGYGHTCDTGWSPMTYPDQASCVKDFSSPTNTPDCVGTVRQMESCVNSIKVCASFDDLKNSAECAPITNC